MPAKKKAVRRVVKDAGKPPHTPALYSMTVEVKEWIDRASSTITHQKSEIERLKRENAELKAWRKWAEHRILRSDHE